MSISFSCDFCSRKYRVDEGLSGRKVKCKECGTDLTIPQPGAVVLTESDYAAKSHAPHRDLYGLDDEDDSPVEAPIPRRPGASASSSSSSRGYSGGTSDGQLWRVVGVVIAVVVAIPVAVFVLGAIQGTGMPKPLAPNERFANANGNANANRNAPPPPPNFPAPNMPQAPTLPASSPPGIFLTLTDGKATRATSLTGRPSSGVEFSADYHVSGTRPHDVVRFYAVVKGPRARASGSMMGMQRDSGTVGGSVMTMSQNDGPFEMYIEGEVFGPGGMTRHKVSDTIALPWTELPQQQPQPQQPPQRPGYPGVGQPSGFPGQPGYRPPGMPVPRYGPRGRP